MTKNLGKLDDLLNRFQKAADDGKYKRIPYTQWKKLKTADKCKAKIVTDENTGEWFAQIIRKEDDKLVLEFDVEDQSFGEFLSTEILTGGIDNMPPTDKQVYSWINNESSGYYDLFLGKIEYDPSNTVSTSSNYTIGYGEQTNRTDPTIKLSDFGKVYSDKTNESLTQTFVTKDEFNSALATKEDKKPLNNDKENVKMKGFNFDFGPCTNNAVKMSLYGLAVKNSTGTWVSYDTKTQSIIDVDILNFDGAKYLYKIPTAIKDIAEGDIVVHAGKPMFVLSTTAKSLHVIDPISGEKKEIMLTRSPFGFDFATKIVNFLGNFMDSAATPDTPFGNMWMLMLAQGENSDLSNILPFMFMNGGAANMNPMMMYFLLGNKGGNDSLLPLMFMMNNTPAPANTCKCGGDCACGKADINA